MHRELIRWTKNHYWDSLEKDKDLIIRHMRTFAGDWPICPHCVNTQQLKRIFICPKCGYEEK